MTYASVGIKQFVTSQLDYPPFIDFIISDQMFDPSLYFLDFPSHIYNELPHDIFQIYLDKMIEKNNEENMEKNDVIDIVQINANIFHKKNKSYFLIVLHHLMKANPIFYKWKYRLVDIFIFESFFTSENRINIRLKMKVCLHRTSCAYAKVLDLELEYNTQTLKSDILKVRLQGIVPQQNI